MHLISCAHLLLKWLRDFHLNVKYDITFELDTNIYVCVCVCVCVVFLGGYF